MGPSGSSASREVHGPCSPAPGRCRGAFLSELLTPEKSLFLGLLHPSSLFLFHPENWSPFGSGKLLGMSLLSSAPAMERGQEGSVLVRFRALLCLSVSPALETRVHSLCRSEDSVFSYWSGHFGFRRVTMAKSVMEIWEVTTKFEPLKKRVL